jgi:peroxiredoxin
MSALTQHEIQVGEIAPDFTLPSTGGAPVTLSSFAGQKYVLLAFFPLAFTSVCTAEMCSFWDDVAKFEAADTKVFGISVDHTASQKAFQQQAKFSVELLSDFKRDVSRAYGVLLEEQNFSKRAYFLIDRAGVVRWKNVERELGDRRENKELLTAIRSLA